jgi:hypothetical protein
MTPAPSQTSPPAGATAPRAPASAISTIPPAVAAPLRSPSTASEEDLFDTLDLTPVEEHLPAIDLEEEDTSPALRHSDTPRPPPPSTALQTLAVEPGKAAQMRQRITAARVMEEELGVDLDLDLASVPPGDSEVPIDVALEEYDPLLGPAGGPVLTPDDSGIMPALSLNEPPVERLSQPEVRSVAVPRAAPESSASPEWLVTTPEPEGPSPSERRNPQTDPPRPAPVFDLSSSTPEIAGEVPIVTAQAQISVPVEVQIAPGTNRISLSLQLVIRLREKR